MKEQINEQLGLLENELSKLKKVTDYIDDTKKNAQAIVLELKEVQNNYSTYTEKIFSLYQKTVEQLKRETELQIKEAVVQFETTGNQIDRTNREKLVETKRLLENYKNTVEATVTLISTIESIDFPSRLDAIDEGIKNNLSKISERLDYQDKENKTIKIFLFAVTILVIVILVVNFVGGV